MTLELEVNLVFLIQVFPPRILKLTDVLLAFMTSNELIPIVANDDDRRAERRGLAILESTHAANVPSDMLVDNLANSPILLVLAGRTRLSTSRASYSMR